MKPLSKYLSRFEALEKTSEMQRSPAWNVCWRNLQVPVRPKPAVDVHRLELTKKGTKINFPIPIKHILIMITILISNSYFTCGASQPFFWKLHFLPEV